MATRATMSLYGLYTYDDTIFDELHLPDSVDKDTIIENLLLNSIELEVLYPDPETVKSAISIYTRAKLPTWTKIAEVLDSEYNPLWNVDGKTIQQSGERKSKTTTDPVDSTETYGATHTETTTGLRHSKSESATSAYNSTGMQPTGESNATTDQATDTADTTGVTNNFKTGTVSSNNVINAVEDVTIRQGNIGVTTTQSMINEELELRKNNNIYDIIVNDIIHKLCIMVY